MVDRTGSSTIQPLAHHRTTETTTPPPPGSLGGQDVVQGNGHRTAANVTRALDFLKSTATTFGDSLKGIVEKAEKKVQAMGETRAQAKIDRWERGMEAYQKIDRDRGVGELGSLLKVVAGTHGEMGDMHLHHTIGQEIDRLKTVASDSTARGKPMDWQGAMKQELQKSILMGVDLDDGQRQLKALDRILRHTETHEKTGAGGDRSDYAAILHDFRNDIAEALSTAWALDHPFEKPKSFRPLARRPGPA